MLFKSLTEEKGNNARGPDTHCNETQTKSQVI